MSGSDVERAAPKIMNTNARVTPFLAVLCLALLSACVTDRQVLDQAEGAHDQLEPAVIDDPGMRDYLQSMGARIVSAAKALEDEGYGPKSHFDEKADWMFSDEMRFHFVNSTTLNAFTTGGKHMYIYTELLKTCRTEDELAAVMAHEYGHVYARHVQKGMDRQYLVLGGAVLAGIGGYAAGGKKHGLEYGSAAAALAYAGGSFLGLGFTRDDEAEADELGFDFYARAGWDPARFGDFFQQLIDKGFDSESDTTSDHPTLKSRVAAAKSRAARLPATAAAWRRPPVADGQAFAAQKKRAEEIAKSMPSDESLQTAQTLLSAVASCVSPTDQPEQKDARAKIEKAMADESAKSGAAKP